MKTEFLSSVAVIAPDAPTSRKLYVVAVLLLAVGSAASTGVSRPPLTAPNRNPLGAEEV